MMRDLATGSEKTLLNPAPMNKAGHHFSVNYFQPSNDGRYVAYTMADIDGKNTLHIIDTETGKSFRETITRTNPPSVSWRADNRSFYYSRLRPETLDTLPSDLSNNARAYLHILGRSRRC